MNPELFLQALRALARQYPDAVVIEVTPRRNGCMVVTWDASGNRVTHMARA